VKLIAFESFWKKYMKTKAMMKIKEQELQSLLVLCWNWSDRHARPVRPVLPGGSAKKARNAPIGDQDKCHLGQHLQVILIISA